MSDTQIVEVRGEVADARTLGLIESSEIEQQISTARRYPRSITRFMEEARNMATLDPSVAEGCRYVLKRSGKNIDGPSARLAEIIGHAWGNCRFGARIVQEEEEFITARGVFHDLEKNVAISFDVRRRITDSNGRRYNADMIGVTGNAASSIALRNAVFKGVPKAFWSPIYDAVVSVIRGDIKTLESRRAEAILYFKELGVPLETICKKLDVQGVEDIGLDELATLKGIATAIKEGEVSAKNAFADDSEDENRAPFGPDWEALKSSAREAGLDNRSFEAFWDRQRKAGKTPKEANSQLRATFNLPVAEPAKEAAPAAAQPAATPSPAEPPAVASAPEPAEPEPSTASAAPAPGPAQPATSKSSGKAGKPSGRFSF